MSRVRMSGGPWHSHREQYQLSDLLTTHAPGSHHSGGLRGGSQGWRLFRCVWHALPCAHASTQQHTPWLQTTLPPPPRRLNAARHRVSNAAPVHRNPGMAIIYSESPFLVPAVFKRLVESWGVHSIVVFLTIRQVGWVGGWLMVCVRREAPLGKAGSHTTRGPSCCNSEVPKDQSTHTHTREHAHEHEKHTRTCTHRCRCRTCTSNSACCWRRSSTAAFTRLSRATATSTRSTRCGSRVESTAGLASM
jgi:hypothetical protein